MKQPKPVAPLVESAVVNLLEVLGEDTAREGLKDTPRRVAAFYREMMDRRPFTMTTFKNEGIDEMIVQDGIQFFSLCEHHMVPFFGTAVVGYVPGKRIVGLSKLARLVQYHARGLNNQERITQAVANALQVNLRPQGVGVLLKARHLCLEMRGPRTPGAETTTSCLLGALRTKPAARAEFLALARASMGGGR